MSKISLGTKHFPLKFVPCVYYNKSACSHGKNHETKGPVTLSQIPHRYRPCFHIRKVTRIPCGLWGVGGNVEKVSDLRMRHRSLSG